LPRGCELRKAHDARPHLAARFRDERGFATGRRSQDPLQCVGGQFQQPEQEALISTLRRQAADEALNRFGVLSADRADRRGAPVSQSNHPVIP
jgi:hypothetical protein